MIAEKQLAPYQLRCLRALPSGKTATLDFAQAAGYGYVTCWSDGYWAAFLGNAISVAVRFMDRPFFLSYLRGYGIGSLALKRATDGA